MMEELQIVRALVENFHNSKGLKSWAWEENIETRHEIYRILDEMMEKLK